MSGARSIVTAAIADDEPLARRKIRDYLKDTDWVRCVGEAGSGPAALKLANDLKPDLLFLDVRMPGLDGLEVLARLEHKPVVIFTTAYDAYAVTAFELRALDYLLKPFGRIRFMAALERARETLTGTGRSSASARAHDAIDPTQPLRTVFVRAPHRLVRVAVEDISRFEARDDYVAMHTPSGRLLASLRMDELERMLDPDMFLRVHRSHIVNLEAVVSITPDRSGRFLIAMRDGICLMCSRRRARKLRRRAV